MFSTRPSKVSKSVSSVTKRLFGTSNGGPSVLLNNGASMPLIAFGTWKTPRDLCPTAVSTALSNGYRNIDCANDYNNEDCVGEGINEVLNNKSKYGVSRDDIFVQAKLWNTNHRAEHVMEDLEATLDDLGLDYIDSFVIHWPQAAPASGDFAATRRNGAYPQIYDKTDSNTRPTMFPIQSDGYFYHDKACHYIETWVAMQECVDRGLTRSIGVSNFTITQMNEIIKYSELNGLKYRVPSVLQVECHPYLQQKDLIDYCNCNGIVFQAFSSLGSGDTHLAVSESPTGTIPLKDPYIAKLAKKYGKSEGQIILRWHVQRKNGSYGLVTKSVTESRIISNIQVYDFELSQEDMDGFDALNNGWRHLLWRETSNHPDYPFFDELPYGYQLEKAPLESSSGTSDN